MGGFDSLFVWILIVALIALGNRKSSGSHYRPEERIVIDAAKEKELEEMLKRIELPKGKRVTYAYYWSKDHEFIVEVTYYENRKECYKFIHAKTLDDMERQLKAC